MRTSSSRPCRLVARGRSCRARRPRRRCPRPAAASACSAVRASSAEDQRLETRDDRVTPEDGHRPRRPRACARSAGAAHPQRREVGDELEERRPIRSRSGWISGTRSCHASDSRTRVSSSPKRRSAVRGAITSPSIEARMSHRSFPALARPQVEAIDDLALLDVSALGPGHLVLALPSPSGSSTNWCCS